MKKGRSIHVARQGSYLTGSGQGLGREFALRFAKEGANVAVADINFKKAKILRGK